MKNLTKDNIEFREREIRLTNEDNKEDSMRHMAWFALIGMLIYPSLLVLCDLFQLTNALAHLASIAEIYFISVSGLVSVYFGSNAYSKNRSHNIHHKANPDDEFDNNQP